MPSKFSSAELEAFLDEALPAARMAEIEEALRQGEDVKQQLAAVNGRRDAGVHALGEIWRRHRLSCPTREQLGSYLMGVLSKDAAGYIKFHLETVECRYCVASVDDLRAQQSAAAGETTERRRRYFQTSVGHLQRD